MNSNIITREIHDQIQFSPQNKKLHGELYVPSGANGVVLFVHGSGSRHPPEVVNRMYDAWWKSMILQVTLWTQPYVREDDF